MHGKVGHSGQLRTFEPVYHGILVLLKANFKVPFSINRLFRGLIEGENIEASPKTQASQKSLFDH